MGIVLEVLDVILRMLWNILENIYRMIIPVARKKIDGEIVLITGGGGRIAECIAMEMTKLNVTIVLCDINEDASNRVAEKVRAQGTTAYTFYCDITDEEQVYHLAEEIKKKIGHVTILLNNAGVMYSNSLMNCTDEKLRRQLEINTLSHFWTVKAFLPHMYELNHGHIVTIASIVGITGVKYMLGYCTSKFAAVGFHKSLRAELRGLGKTGIKTTCLCPAMVDTPLLRDVKTSSRFPSLTRPLNPEYVANELVDGILRNKEMLILPKSLHNFLRFKSVLPQKALDVIDDYMNIGTVDDNAHLAFERLKEKCSANDGKKME